VFAIEPVLHDFTIPEKENYSKMIGNKDMWT